MGYRAPRAILGQPRPQRDYTKATRGVEGLGGEVLGIWLAINGELHSSVQISLALIEYGLDFQNIHYIGDRANKAALGIRGAARTDRRGWHPKCEVRKLDQGSSTRKSLVAQTLKRDLEGSVVSPALQERSAHPCMSTKRTRRHNSNHLLTLNIERRVCRMLKHAWVPNVSRIPMLVNRYSSKPHPLRNSSPRHPLASVTYRECLAGLR
jgi:hypothetical protein